MSTECVAGYGAAAHGTDGGCHSGDNDTVAGQQQCGQSAETDVCMLVQALCRGLIGSGTGSCDTWH